MCAFQFSRLSRCIPRYFADSACVRGVSLSVTVGQFPFLVVNVTCTDLPSLAFILHSFSHISIFDRFHCSMDAAIFGFVCDASIAVSSAKVAIVVLIVVGRSDVKIRYSIGPKTLPCGTPDFICFGFVHISWCLTTNFRSLR